jgi:hypothetical protein
LVPQITNLAKRTVSIDIPFEGDILKITKRGSGRSLNQSGELFEKSAVAGADRAKAANWGRPSREREEE